MKTDVNEFVYHAKQDTGVLEKLKQLRGIHT